MIASLARNRVFIGVLQLAATVAIITGVCLTFGAEPFLRALSAVSVPSVLAALGLGALATAIQAQRWRLISGGVGRPVPFRQAVARCWQSGFLNAVLPGGLLGDAHRVAEQRSLSSSSGRRTAGAPVQPRAQRRADWRDSIGPVWAERIAGTAVVVLAAAIALVGRNLTLAVWFAVLAMGVGALAAWALRRRRVRVQIAVWALACASWCVFIVLFGVAAAAAGVAAGTGGEAATRATLLDAPDVLILASVSLAAMSIPIGIGGWGLREGAAALTAGTMGAGAGTAVAVAAAYGVLATISVLPGALVLVGRSIRSARRRARSQVEFDADVVAENEPSAGGSGNL